MAKNNCKNEMYNKFAQAAKKNIKQQNQSNQPNKETKMEDKFNTPTTFAQFNAIVSALNEKAEADNTAKVLWMYGNGVMSTINHVINMVQDQEERDKMLNSEEMFTQFVESAKNKSDVLGMFSDMIEYLNSGKGSEAFDGVTDEEFSALGTDLDEQVKSNNEKVGGLVSEMPKTAPTEEESEIAKIFKKCAKAGIGLDEPTKKPKCIQDIRDAVKVIRDSNPKEKSAEYKLMVFWTNVARAFNQKLIDEGKGTAEHYEKAMKSKKAFKELVEPIQNELLNALFNAVEKINAEKKSGIFFS